MSERTLKYVLVAFLLTGIAISSYLTYIHYADIEPICTVGGGCETVQKSEYAVILGMSVALIGLLGDSVILALILLGGMVGRYLAFGLALTALGFTGYLTYLELAVIHAICQWCVAHAVVVLAVTVLVAYSVLRMSPSDHLPSTGQD